MGYKRQYGKSSSCVYSRAQYDCMFIVVWKL
jgi:hypothetical protein